MTATRGTTIATAVVATAVAMALAASSWGGAAEQSRERPRGVVEDCSTRSGANFPDAFTSPRHLVVGPLVLMWAGGSPDFIPSSDGTEGWNKFAALVREGRQVTVELSRETRRGAGLAYGPLPQGEVQLRETHRVVSFVACRRDERSGNRASGRHITFWSGGVVARSPRCVPLLVWVDSEPRPRRAVIRLGVPDCG